MTRRSRRTVLCGTAGLFALSAGCLDEAGLSDDDADGTDDESDSDGDDTGAAVEGLELEEYEAVAFELDRPREPDATLLAEADRAGNWLADRDLDAETYTEFVAETAFDDSVLLGLEATGRSLDYGLELETVAVETEDAGEGQDGEAQTFVVEAAVYGDEEAMSGQQMIGVGQLVRATFAGEPPTEARVTIVDADGVSHEMRIDVDGASESDGD